jgi:hypothetical protein
MARFNLRTILSLINPKCPTTDFMKRSFGVCITYQTIFNDQTNYNKVAGHAARIGDMRIVYRIFGGKPETTWKL